MTEIAKISKIAENCRIRTRLDYVSQPGVRPKSSSVLLSDVSPISPNSIVPVPKPRLLSKSRSRLKQPSKVRLSSGTNISITSKIDINNNTTSLTNFSEATNFKKNANKSASNSENILNNNNKIEAQKTSTSSFPYSSNNKTPHQTSSNFSKNQTNKVISSLPVPKTNISNCKLNDEVRNCTYNKIWGSSDMAGTNKSDRNMKNLIENTEASENPNPVKSFGDLTKNSTINKSKLPLKSRKKPIFPEAITNRSANNIRSVSPNNNKTNSNNNNMPIRRSNLDKIRESKGWIDHKPRLKSTNMIKERVRLAKDMGQNQTLPKKLHKTEKLQKVSSAAQGINNANKSKTIELASKNYSNNNYSKIKNEEEAQKLTDSFIDNKIQPQKSIEHQTISQVSDKIKAYNTASKLKISAVNYKELEEAEQNLILQLSSSEKDKNNNNKLTPPVVPKRAATTFSKLKTQISQSSQSKSENNNNNNLPLKSLVLPKSFSEQNFQNKQPRSVKVHLFDHNDSTDFSSSEVSDGFHNKKLKKRSKDSSVSSISSTEIDNFLVQFPNYTSSVSRKINKINNNSNNPSDLKPSASSYCLSETTTSSSSELCEEIFPGSETPRRKKLNLTSVSSRCSNMLGQKNGNKVKRSRSSAALSKFNRGLFWKKKPQQILEEGEETAVSKTKQNNSDLHSASLANIPSPPNMFVPPPPSMDQTTKKLSKQFEIDTKTTKSKNVNLDLPTQDMNCNTSIGHRLAQNSQVNLDNSNNNENIYQARPHREIMSSRQLLIKENHKFSLKASETLRII